MQYKVKAKDEAAWVGIGTAAGGLVGAILILFGVESTAAVAVATSFGGFVAAVTRVIIGHFLPTPEPPTGGTPTG